MLLADPVPEEVHGPMQGGRNNDDGDEPEQRVPGEEPRHRPWRDPQAQEEPAHDEIVVIEPGGFRSPRRVHPTPEGGSPPAPRSGAAGEDPGAPKTRSRGPATP